MKTIKVALLLIVAVNWVDFAYGHEVNFGIKRTSDDESLDVSFVEQTRFVELFSRELNALIRPKYFDATLVKLPKPHVDGLKVSVRLLEVVTGEPPLTFDELEDQIGGISNFGPQFEGRPLSTFKLTTWNNWTEPLNEDLCTFTPRALGCSSIFFLNETALQEWKSNEQKNNSRKKRIDLLGEDATISNLTVQEETSSYSLDLTDGPEKLLMNDSHGQKAKLLSDIATIETRTDHSFKNFTEAVGMHNEHDKKDSSRMYSFEKEANRLQSRQEGKASSTLELPHVTRPSTMSTSAASSKFSEFKLTTWNSWTEPLNGNLCRYTPKALGCSSLVFTNKNALQEWEQNEQENNSRKNRIDLLGEDVTISTPTLPEETFFYSLDLTVEPDKFLMNDDYGQNEKFQSDPVTIRAITEHSLENFTTAVRSHNEQDRKNSFQMYSFEKEANHAESRQERKASSTSELTHLTETSPMSTTRSLPMLRRKEIKVVQLNQKVTLSCNGGSYWRCFGDGLEMKKKFGAIWTMDSVQNSDDGLYICYDKNETPVRPETRIAVIDKTNVPKAPRFLEPEGLQIFNSGSELSFAGSKLKVKSGTRKVTLTCQVHPAGSVKIAWLRSGGRSMPLESKQFGRMLRMYNVKPKDEGVYVCVTRAGSLSAAVHLRVLEKNE